MRSANTGVSLQHVESSPARDSLWMRVIGAILFAAPAIAVGIVGGYWFFALVLAAICLATREMVIMMRVSGFNPSLGIALTITILSFAAVSLPSLPIAPLLTLVILLSLSWQMRHQDGKPVADWAIAVAGGAYLGWMGGHLAALRQLTDGWWLLSAVLLTWTADTGAYAVGKLFGQHRFAPHLSPKKTWEGYMGGIVSAIAAGILLGVFAPMGVLHLLATGLLIGLLGPFGDLAESMFKRQAKVKDSGHLIPGHGGVFDRIDSLLWTGAITFYYATLVYPALNP